ncbi:hypothetical protein VIGAN_02327300 [Vigna angularis var. angularis]|uniref:Uncharacterized protein n=1 Tax=Vigna angularis var. angularis TaxID=157739 RepID=A0A0S3RI26_PHAAN|nr:hypothetical protein VIGAN_02327300 [Vigna angularis var. angularis]
MREQLDQKGEEDFHHQLPQCTLNLKNVRLRAMPPVLGISPRLKSPWQLRITVTQKLCPKCFFFSELTGMLKRCKWIIFWCLYFVERYDITLVHKVHLSHTS